MTAVFAPSGNMVACGGMDNMLTIYDLNNRDSQVPCNSGIFMEDHPKIWNSNNIDMPDRNQRRGTTKM